ncbi:MAG: OmpA family protein [Sphingobacteriales bacterium]|nr:OmpA family protein [Sphingobacteriales bacterium]MCC7223480.1 OmpA family protein [Chitinophagales bacterium]
MEAHADCRGGDAYNMGLSQRRADAAMNYLISTGIEPMRLSTTARGSRENQHGYCCKGSTCSEAEFEKDRKIVFIINGAF